MFGGQFFVWWKKHSWRLYKNHSSEVYGKQVITAVQLWWCTEGFTEFTMGGKWGQCENTVCVECWTLNIQPWMTVELEVAEFCGLSEIHAHSCGYNIVSSSSPLFSLFILHCSLSAIVLFPPLFTLFITPFMPWWYLDWITSSMANLVSTHALLLTLENICVPTPDAPVWCQHPVSCTHGAPWFFIVHLIYLAIHPYNVTTQCQLLFDIQHILHSALVGLI